MEAAMVFLIGLIALIVALAAVARVNKLERELRRLRELVENDGVPSRGRKTPAATSLSSSPEPMPEFLRMPRLSVEMPETEHPGSQPTADLPPVIPAAPAEIPSAPAHPPSIPEADSVAPLPGTAGGIGSLEATIGGSWLNRIGVSLLVIGIAFALGYSLTVLGPAGKAALATAVSLGLVVGGVVLERREPYKFYGRGLIGGGWAALYATAYAVHELQATRIIQDPRAGFVLLLLVGLGMIGHSLRYANQGLTAVAYGLAYAAIVLHSISPFTLAAAMLLGAGTILHLIRRRWYGMAFGGIAATYASLFLWYLRQPVMSPQVLRLGLAALAMDWIVFLAADFSGEPDDDFDRVKSRAIALLNALAACLLAFLFWTKVAPGEGWRPLAALGVAYVATSAGLRRLRRLTVHPIHSLLAALFLGVAARLGWKREVAVWFWLAEAQALVVLGARLKDRFHRILGCIVFIAPAGVIAWEQIGARARQPDGGLNSRQLLITLAACACFYFSRWKMAPFVTEGERGKDEAGIRTAFSYAAFFLILLALWVQLPAVYVAPAGAALLLLLFEISAVRKIRELRVQSYLAGAYAAVSCGVLSAPSKALLLGHPARVPAVLAVAAAYFLVFMRQGGGRAAAADFDAALRPAFAWAGTALVALIVWLQARPVAVGPAWMILAMMLVEAGILLAEPHLRRPGYLMLLAAHASLVMSNLTATDQAFGLSIRAVTIVPALAATYYLWWRLRGLSPAPRAQSEDRLDEIFGRVLSYLGGGLAGLFARFQFGLEGAAFRWSLAMVVLLAAGHLLRDADFRLQAYALAGAVFVRGVGFDFRTGGPILGMNGPLAIAVAGVACYIGAGALVRRRRQGTPGTGARAERRTLELETRLESVGQDLLWLLAVALAAIYLYRTGSGFWLIVAWALEGLVVTGAGFLFRTRSLRFSGLGLLALGLAMTLYRTFRYADTPGRIISFIVLGVVLLLISFGYARYRDSIRKSP